MARELLLSTGMRKLKTIDLAALAGVHGGDGAAPDPSACPGGQCGAGAAAGGGGGGSRFGGGQVLAGLGSVLNPIMGVVQTAIQARAQRHAAAAQAAPQQGDPQQQPPMPSAMGGGGGGGGGGRHHHGGVNVSISVG